MGLESTILDWVGAERDNERPYLRGVLACGHSICCYSVRLHYVLREREGSLFLLTREIGKLL